MWCYSFSCSSCCYLSSTCSFSQSLNRGNFWRAEKELVQQHLSSSSGADPIFLLRCQQSGRRGLGRSRLSRGCAGESCLPCLWVGELCLHEFPIRNIGWHLSRAAENKGITSTSISPPALRALVQTGFQPGCRLPQRQHSLLSLFPQEGW